MARTITVGAAVVLSLAIVCGISVGRAHAFPGIGTFETPATMGGGGGKYFTGVPSDGYTCIVCHHDATPATFSVTGLPDNGFDPGRSYELTVQWPDTAQQGVTEARGPGCEGSSRRHARRAGPE